MYGRRTVLISPGAVIISAPGSLLPVKKITTLSRVYVYLLRATAARAYRAIRVITRPAGKAERRFATPFVREIIRAGQKKAARKKRRARSRAMTFALPPRLSDLPREEETEGKKSLSLFESACPPGGSVTRIRGDSPTAIKNRAPASLERERDGNFRANEIVPRDNFER